MRNLLRLAGFRAALAYTGILLVAMALVMGLLYGRLASRPYNSPITSAIATSKMPV